MELRHLRYFIAVAEELHFGRAAMKLNISQPPLSQQIMKLEDELGLKLFIRTKRSVKLTLAGVAFHRRAKTILSSLISATEEAKSIEREKSDRLNIGIMSSLTLNLILPVLKRFQRICPSTKLTFIQLDTPQQYTSLEDGHIDIGIVDDRILQTTPMLPYKNIETRITVNRPLSLAVPNNHWLTSKKKWDISSLSNEKFVLLGRKSYPSFHDATLEICIKNGFSPEISYETDQLPVALTLVAAGYGITFAPDPSPEVWGKEISFLEMPHKPSINISIISRKEDLTMSASTFFDIAKGEL